MDYSHSNTYKLARSVGLAAIASVSLSACEFNLNPFDFLRSLFSGGSDVRISSSVGDRGSVIEIDYSEKHKGPSIFGNALLELEACLMKGTNRAVEDKDITAKEFYMTRGWTFKNTCPGYLIEVYNLREAKKLQMEREGKEFDGNKILTSVLPVPQEDNVGNASGIVDMAYFCNVMKDGRGTLTLGWAPTLILSYATTLGKVVPINNINNLTTYEIDPKIDRRGKECIEINTAQRIAEIRAKGFAEGKYTISLGGFSFVSALARGFGLDDIMEMERFLEQASARAANDNLASIANDNFQSWSNPNAESADVTIPSFVGDYRFKNNPDNDDNGIRIENLVGNYAPKK